MIEDTMMEPSHASYDDTVDSGADAEYVADLERRIVALEKILFDHGLGHLIPPDPSDVFMDADLPWLTPEARRELSEVPEVLGSPTAAAGFLRPPEEDGDVGC